MVSFKFLDLMGINKKQQLMQIHFDLKQDFENYRPLYKSVASWLAPARYQYLDTDLNRGISINGNVIDTTASQSLRTLEAGMLSGVSSPSRRWFTLSHPDRELSEDVAVKRWLDKTSKDMFDVLRRSSFYSNMQSFYGTAASFGVAAMYVEEDFEKVVSFMTLPIGTFNLGVNSKNEVNMFSREFPMTVAQIVEKFGYNEFTNKIDWTNISDQVRTMFENRQYQTLITLCHVITPNGDYDPNRPESRYKKFRSYYFELGASQSGHKDTTVTANTKILEDKGYDYFPIVTARWEISGLNTYSHNFPALIALGDIKQLQTGERKSLKAIDKTVDPPMVGPTSLRNQKTSLLPNDITFVDENSGSGQFRAAHDIRFNIRDMEDKQIQVRDRIRKAFFEDLFLMLANSDRRQITATEIEERHEEKLLALGPVLENLNHTFDHLIDILFDIMVKQERIEEPPDVLDGEDLRVEYISIMAQAQKLVGLGAVERMTNYSINISQAYPGALKKYKGVESIDEMANILGINPNLIRTDDEVEEMEAAEAAAVAQQQQLAMAEQAASTAKTMSETDLADNSALREAMTGV